MSGKYGDRFAGLSPSARAKAMWTDPRIRKARIENRKKTIIKLWADPKWHREQASRHSTKMKAWWAVPENKARMMKVRKAQATPQEKARLLALVKKNWADPKMRKRICKIRKTQSKGNMLRHPEGSFYRTMYNGLHGEFWMRSSWEVAFAKWMDAGGIDWEYEKKRFWLDAGRYYRPDFYLPDQDCYVEIKGWITDDCVRKLERFRELYPDVQLEVFEFRHLKAMLAEYKVLAKVISFPDRMAA